MSWKKSMWSKWQKPMFIFDVRGNSMCGGVQGTMVREKRIPMCDVWGLGKARHLIAVCQRRRNVHQQVQVKRVDMRQCQFVYQDGHQSNGISQDHCKKEAKY